MTISVPHGTLYLLFDRFNKGEGCWHTPTSERKNKAPWLPLLETPALSTCPFRSPGSPLPRPLRFIALQSPCHAPPYSSLSTPGACLAAPSEHLHSSFLSTSNALPTNIPDLFPCLALLQCHLPVTCLWQPPHHMVPHQHGSTAGHSLP